MASIEKITLRSSDGDEFEISETTAKLSEVIWNMVKDNDGQIMIPLPNATTKILSKVLEYCKKHVDAVAAGETSDWEMKTWDRDYINLDPETIFDIILAANYLHIKGLLDLACQHVADMIKGKTPDEIRKTFDIKGEITPEEEEEIRRENQWAFE